MFTAEVSVKYWKFADTWEMIDRWVAGGDMQFVYILFGRIFLWWSAQNKPDFVQHSAIRNLDELDYFD